MHIEVYYDVVGDNWDIDDDPWPGRISGDDYTNPDPDFVDWGITGLSSYQGRLVILSGPWVWLRSTINPRVFSRSAVVGLIDSDNIVVWSGLATGSAFILSFPFI